VHCLFLVHFGWGFLHFNSWRLRDLWLVLANEEDDPVLLARHSQVALAVSYKKDRLARLHELELEIDHPSDEVEDCCAEL